MIRVALIGCGSIAESGHLPTLLAHPRFQVIAVCDDRPERAHLLAQKAGGVATYEDWRRLLDHEAIDAAILALPPEISPDVAVACLERGLHVLDEKPLAATLEDGRRIARAVAEARGIFQVGFVLRYGDLITEVGRWARAIGTPSRTSVAIFDERLDREDRDHLERIKGFLRNSSAMTHEGSHVIDYARLWNPARWTKVLARTECTEADFAGPNHWWTAIDLADGSKLEVEIGWLLPELPPCTVAIEGPNGRLEVDLRTGLGRRWFQGDFAKLTLPPLNPEWTRQYDAFARGIDQGVSQGATVEDGLLALEVTSACEASRRTGAEVVCSKMAPSCL